MEINSLGTAYLDDYRLNASKAGLSGVSGQFQALNSGPNFAELLNKAAPAPQNDAPSGTSGAGDRTVSIDKKDKLYEQCLELEIFMVKTLISSMRNTVQKSGLIDEGFAGKMYEDMLYDEYARDFTKNANFGMAEQAYLELSGQRGKVLIRE